MKKAGEFFKKQVSRRTILKGGAAIAGSTAITGFPTVWAQNIKDVTLVHTGMSYSTIADIAKQASKDLGFKIEMSVVDHPGLLNRMVNDPKSIDIADMEIWQTKIAVPQGVTQAAEITKIKDWSKLTPLYTEGTFAGKEVSRQGDAPIKFMYRDSIDAKTFAKGKTAFATFVPSVYNADTLGIRPDLVGREITTWADLISPDFKGKSRHPEHPDQRHHGCHDGARIGRRDQVRRQGQPDPGRTRQDDRAPDRAEEGRSLPRPVEHVRREREPDGRWRGGHPVDVVAGGHRGQGAGRQVRLPAAQGRLSRLGQRPCAHGASRRRQTRRGLRVPQLVQFRLGRRLHRQAGLLQRQRRDRRRRTSRENERGFFYEGKAATADITSPTGEKTNSAGEVRDGGSYEERFSKVAVWNNLMDEAEFLYAKWNEFNAA